MILIHSDSGQQDTPENIHSPSEIDEESFDVKKMENIFSSYCTQKKVSRHLWLDPKEGITTLMVGPKRRYHVTYGWAQKKVSRHLWLDQPA